MLCPVALNIKENNRANWDYRSLAHGLHTLSPYVAYWDELPNTLWVEAAKNPVKGLSKTAFVARLINHLSHLDYNSSAVWGCAPYAAALIAQTLPKGRFIKIESRHQHGVIDSLSIKSLNLGFEAEQSLNRLGLYCLRDLYKLPRHALESRYGTALKLRLKMLSGEPPNWHITTPKKVDSKALIIDDEITHLQALLFLTKSTTEQNLLELAARGLACHELVLSARTQDSHITTWSIYPTQPTLDVNWLIELLRLKLENTHLNSPIKEAWVALKSQPATHQQLSLFNTRKRDLKTSNEVLDRLRAEFGGNLIFTASVQPNHHPKDAGVWVPHQGHWPQAHSINKKRSWVRRLLQKPLPIDRPQPNKPWVLCGELATDIGGPYPIEQRWWDTPQTEHEYLVRVQSGRVLWVLCDQQTQLWRVIGWVA